MINSINVNHTSQTYANIAKAHTANGSINQSMIKALAGKIEEAAGVSKASEVSTQEMTMEEYKEYIADKISRLPVDPSQALSSTAVHISEKGFEAMKNDPEYEKWVMDTLEYDFAFHDPWCNRCGGAYAVHYFGESKETYRGMGWYKGYQNGKGEELFNDKAKDSFWSRRAKKNSQIEQQNKKHLEKQRLQKAAYEKAVFEARMMTPAVGTTSTGTSAVSVAVSVAVTSASAAISSYESGFGIME